MSQNSSEFKKLQAEWYKKLKDTGFNDIEQDEENLKVWSLRQFSIDFNETTYRAKEDYYRLAGEFLYTHPFKDPVERKIWELHGAGKSITDISLYFKANKPAFYKRKLNRRYIHSILNQLTKIMVHQCSKKRI